MPWACVAGSLLDRMRKMFSEHMTLPCPETHGGFLSLNTKFQTPLPSFQWSLSPALTLHHVRLVTNGRRGLFAASCLSCPKPNLNSLSAYKSPRLPSIDLKSTSDRGHHCTLSNYSNPRDVSVLWTPFALRVPTAQLITALSYFPGLPSTEATALISTIRPRGFTSTRQTVQKYVVM